MNLSNYFKKSGPDNFFFTTYFLGSLNQPNQLTVLLKSKTKHTVAVAYVRKVEKEKNRGVKALFSVRKIQVLMPTS